MYMQLKNDVRETKKCKTSDVVCLFSTTKNSIVWADLQIRMSQVPTPGVIYLS